MKKILYSLLTLTLGLVLSGSGCDTGPDPLPDVKVSSIAITPTAAQSVQAGKTITLSVSITPSNATNKAVTWTSDTPALATVNASGVVTGVSAGTATIRATAKDESGKTATKTVTVTPDPDAGVLINGLTWATRNVAAPGVFATTPESVGMFYQWNRRVGYSATNPLTPAWNALSAEGASWATANDPCPAGWRVPTKADFDKLVTYDQGWNAAKQGNTFGTAPNTIFLPAAGWREASVGGLNGVGIVGNYWANTEWSSSEAYRLNIESGFSARSNISFGKASGLSIRCVKN